MKALLALIKKLYGSKALQNALGTRTNVITLPDKNTKKFITNESNIEAASDAAVDKAFKDAEKLIPDIPKMNDQEILTFTGNLQRLDNKLNPPSAPIIDIKTKKPVTGIEKLAEERGFPRGMEPDSPLGQLLQSSRKVDDEAKELQKMMTESPSKAFEEMVLKNPSRPGGPLDPAIGITRTAARSLLEKKGIKIENKDPLDLVRENFGQDVLSDLNNLSEELLEIERRGGSYKDIDKILDNEGFFDLKINKNAPKGLSDEELRKKLKEFEEDPEGFAKGGRVGYAEGSPDQKQMAMVEDMLKRGMDMDTIKTLTGASDEMIQDRINFIKYGGAKVPIKKETRTKQAGGGVAYLMGL